MREKLENLFKEIVDENFTNPGKNLDFYVHETNKSSQNLNPQ